MYLSFIGIFRVFFLFFHLRHIPLLSLIVSLYLSLWKQVKLISILVLQECPWRWSSYVVSVCPMVLVGKLELKWPWVISSPRTCWQTLFSVKDRLEIEDLQPELVWSKTLPVFSVSHHPTGYEFRAQGTEAEALRFRSKLALFPLSIGIYTMLGNGSLYPSRRQSCSKRCWSRILYRLGCVLGWFINLSEHRQVSNLFLCTLILFSLTLFRGRIGCQPTQFPLNMHTLLDNSTSSLVERSARAKGLNTQCKLGAC